MENCLSDTKQFAIKDNFTNDDYETPDYVAEPMAKLLLPSEKVILEPCAGSGQIAKYVCNYRSDAVVDCLELKFSRFAQGIQQVPAANWYNCDFLKSNLGKTYDCVIGNLPFSAMLDFIDRSLDCLKRRDSSRLLFLMPIDWYSAQKRAKKWESLDAHIHCIYAVKGRVDYLINGKPCSETQKVKNGMLVYRKNGEPEMMSGRQVSDAVFDIRLGSGSLVTYL